jgi:cytochrome o ubiquinol oxidase subunit II
MRDKKRVVKRLLQVAISAFIAVAFIATLVYFTQGREIPVLQPAGTIAYQQYVLILVSVGLGVFVVLPVFILLFTIAWKYREGNTNAKYDPDLHGNLGLELLWWGIPALIIIVLAIITAISTHALDPYRPLQSDKEPVKVQVVALEWKWLFIYPDQGIATVNYMNIPEDTPVNLTITADAPMNSFWVPALAGQVYAMTGMSTKLHLMADQPGTYNGSSANLSGDGFANMRFKVNSLSQDDFNAWIQQSMNSDDWLTPASYEELEKPSKAVPEKTYGLIQGNIYDEVILKYMGPMDTTHVTEGVH